MPHKMGKGSGMSKKDYARMTKMEKNMKGGGMKKSGGKRGGKK